MRTWAQKCVPTVVSLSTKILIPRRAQKKCDHRSITAYEDTHTTEAAKSSTLYLYISLFRGIAAKEQNIEIRGPKVIEKPRLGAGPRNCCFSLSFFQKK